ncbi:MAG: glycosyltransferase family 39 protein [Candidatus Marinimicrobia bacterium]|nr:glycosyltransferase family 39 protein [Candidatus Neomarinimicrobiota bacterium]
MKKRKNYLILVAIVLLAACLRLWGLGINPPSLAWDEAAWGYNAYSLGLTGRDEFGQFLPLDYLESFGDFKPPVYAYLAVLPVKILGLNEMSVRLPSALLGVLTVLFTYFLTKEIFKTKKTWLPLTAAFLLAISPWHMLLSRAAFEANVATFFLVAGVTFFLIGVERRSWFLLPAAVSFALSFQTFNTTRIVAPLLVLGLAVGFRKGLWQKKKWALGAGFVALIILLPALSFLTTPQSRLRYQEVNIFSDPEIVIRANQAMANDHWAWWSRIIHNRRWGYARAYLRHYFDHFNPDFLFIKGDGNPKFSTQSIGQFFLWELPFLVGGAFLLFQKRERFWWVIPFWLLLGIMPAATARETPHALRIEATLPTWQIMTALGVVAFGDWAKGMKKKRGYLIMMVVFSFLGLNWLYFQHLYWRHYPIEYAGEWQYGYKPAVEYAKTVEDNYQEIWVTEAIGRPYIYFLFYLQKDPREFWQEAQVEREVWGFVKVKSFGRYHFFNQADFDREGKILYIDKADNLPPGAKVLKTIYLPNGQEILKAFEI